MVWKLSVNSGYLLQLNILKLNENIKAEIYG